MAETSQNLADSLSEGLQASGLSAAELSQRTRVPETTILAFLALRDARDLPERAYLWAHLGLLCREIRLDHERLRPSFDQRFPVPTISNTSPSRSNAIASSAWSRVLVTGLGAAALLAMVMAAASSIG